MAKRKTKARAAEQPKKTPEVVRETKRPARGTRAGEAALLTATEGVRAVWASGDLQKAGRDVLRGKTGLRSALGALARPAREVLDRAVKEHRRVAEEERPVEAQLAAALRESPEKRSKRAMKRGGKTETVMRGVVRGPDGAPVPGLVVEGRRAGTKQETLLAADVTDAEGRYQLVVPNEELGSAKSANLSVAIGLEREAALHRPQKTFKIETGTATEHELTLPEEGAARARQYADRLRELDVARVHALNRRGALRALEQQQLGTLVKGLGELLGGRRRT